MRRLTITVLILMFFGLSAAMADSSNKEKKHAYKLYKSAKERYAKVKSKKDRMHLCLEIANQLQKAIKLVQKDTPRLHYEFIEQRLIPGTGRWVEYEDVRISYDKSYFPNRLLSKIRKQYPPQPLAVVNIIAANSGDNTVEVELFNQGRTRMDKIKVGIKADSLRSHLETIAMIEPGDSQKLRWRVPKFGTCKVRFTEHFSYAPCEIKFLN